MTTERFSKVKEAIRYAIGKMPDNIARVKLENALDAYDEEMALARQDERERLAEILIKGKYPPKDLQEAFEKGKQAGRDERERESAVAIAETVIKENDTDLRKRIAELEAECARLGGLSLQRFDDGASHTEDRLWDFIMGKTEKPPETSFTSGRSRDIAREFKRLQAENKKHFEYWKAASNQVAELEGALQTLYDKPVLTLSEVRELAKNALEKGVK